MAKFLALLIIDEPYDELLFYATISALGKLGFVPYATLPDGEVTNLPKWAFWGEAENDEDLPHRIAVAVSTATGRDLIVLTSPGEPMSGWYTPGTRRAVQELDPDLGKTDAS